MGLSWGDTLTIDDFPTCPACTHRFTHVRPDGLCRDCGNEHDQVMAEREADEREIELYEKARDDEAAADAFYHGL